ncbi:MAG: 3'(2'),5'-bisphosphate nucleotidase [Micavibrio aeruginosavorus]|uniref:3'(2'),5'-bisphosphate nucleotidase CysQ n=1 Tax=Micavibrio aeruginosavorus TaxID=349221 RepID=A0A2W5FBL9_9BACT|nr:MAG: 3'(2'),5'-bisphosphate nucleotidase [Micavibrio aeruginosavorus]
MTSKILQHLPALCNQIKRLAVEAGEATLEFYDESGAAEYTDKLDGSPVTLADHAAHKIIMEGLAQITPEVPVISEESEAHPEIMNAEYFWCVDPLDGTRGFIQGNPDYTVNIALIKNNEPVLGVIYAPVLGELYSGHGEGTAIRYLEDTRVEKQMFMRPPRREGMNIVISNFKGQTPKQDQLLEQFKVAKVMKRASSIKFCLVASGKADFYLCMKEISEWDTAAGDAIVRSAGGVVVDMNGVPLQYGKFEKAFRQPFFQATSGLEFTVDLNFG